MNVLIKDYHDHSTDMTYPCLLECKSSSEVNDVILAVCSDGDFCRSYRAKQ